jgi:hypothetical protein
MLQHFRNSPGHLQQVELRIQYIGLSLAASRVSHWIQSMRRLLEAVIEAEADGSRVAG